MGFVCLVSFGFGLFEFCWFCFGCGFVCLGFVCYMGSKHSSLVFTEFQSPQVQSGYQVFKMSGLYKLRALRFLCDKGSVISGFLALRTVPAAYAAERYRHKIFNLNSNQDL